MRFITAMFVAFASLSLACGAYAAIETPKGMPEPGAIIGAAPVACSTLEDARKFVDLAHKNPDEASAFVQAEGNTCYNSRGRFSVLLIEYVERRGDAVIVKIKAPTQLSGVVELYAAYKVTTEKQSDAKGLQRSVVQF